MDGGVGGEGCAGGGLSAVSTGAVTKFIDPMPSIAPTGTLAGETVFITYVPLFLSVTWHFFIFSSSACVLSLRSGKLALDLLL